ncbi:NAD(P)/FAD-dependent oxidoreductase [Streptomyces tritici]|uniref:NAD(P)/FAD-dependent oxidoreductase n=1 Tax=Streptomyces tritici TaxID=2054410 RepID=UPI003AF1BE4B
MSGSDAHRRRRTVEVLIVGAGPAGLSAAATLAEAGAGRVEVLERDPWPGGAPRHCDRPGFGRWRTSSGPEYARRLTEAAVAAGATLRTETTATGWWHEDPDPARPASSVTRDVPSPTRPASSLTLDVPSPTRPASSLTLDVTGPAGLERVTARAVVLATGARERPRSARLVPGTRPAGVLTTGELQQSVHLHGLRGAAIGRRAVVIGAAEPVTRGAVRTLREAGVEVVGVVSEGPRPPAYRERVGAPLLPWTTVTGLVGHGRPTGVTVRHRGGRTGTLTCDTVVFAGDWIPQHELARAGGVPLDPATRGPAVDGAFRTPVPGVFAAGNGLRGAEPAAVAEAEGRQAAYAVLRHLAAAPWPSRTVPLVVEPPLLWVTPNRVGGPDTRRPLLLRPAEPLRLPVLAAVQDGRLLWRSRRWAVLDPARSVRVTPEWTAAVDPDGGPVVLRAR